MKVKELLKFLNECDPDAEIILSSDAEGNKYSPCTTYEDNLLYVPDCAYKGEVFNNPNELLQSYEELPIHSKVVVLWPYN